MTTSPEDQIDAIPVPRMPGIYSPQNPNLRRAPLSEVMRGMNRKQKRDFIKTAKRNGQIIQGDGKTYL